jgi:hypothetical protein
MRYEPIEEPIEEVSDDLSHAKRRREHRLTFLGFAFISALEVGYLFFRPPTFSTLQDWIIAGGAILCPIMAIISFRIMRNDWTDAEADRVTTRTLRYVFLAPFILIGGLLLAVILQSAFESIPFWAVIFILLLFLKK